MRVRILLVTFLALIALGSQAGRFLVVDEPRPADAIVVLAGETSARPARALELLRQGMAPRIFLDVETRSIAFDQPLTEIAKRYASSLPERDRISVCPISALSTFSESDDVNRCMQSQEIRTVMIVTSASHTRRALKIFRRRLPQYQFTTAAAYDPTRFGIMWWTRREWAKTTFDEWIKLLWWEIVDRWRA